MVNIAIIGDSNCGKTSLASKFGKKGTDSDITFFNSTKHEQKYIYIDAKTYPKTLKSFVTAVNLSDIIILCIEIDNLTQYTGECIVALDLLNIKYGIIIITKCDTSYSENIKNFIHKVGTIVKDTNLKAWPIIPININQNCNNPFSGIDKVQEKIGEYSIDINKDIQNYCSLNPRVVIDHFFNVTGIGMVILGKVLKGTINVHDKLILYPINKKIEIRSIQKNDINVKEAFYCDRVGIGIKGILEKELERGYLISADDENISDIIKIKLTMSNYSPIKKLNIGDSFNLFVGLQTDSVKIEDIEYINDTPIITFRCGKKIAFNEDDKIFITSLENKQRFIGIGNIL